MQIMTNFVSVDPRHPNLAAIATLSKNQAVLLLAEDGTIEGTVTYSPGLDEYNFSQRREAVPGAALESTFEVDRLDRFKAVVVTVETGA